MAEKADPKFVTMADAIREFQKQFDSQSEADFFPTGFPSHDNALGRLRRGTVTFIGARPSMGKTALMLSSALKQLEAGIRVVFFSLEMPVTDMIARLVSIKTGISLFDILQRRIDDKQVRRIVGTLPELVKLQGDWSEESALKRIGQLLNQVEPRSRSIVYVDFLGLIQVFGLDASQQYAVTSEIGLALKRAAMQLEIPIVAGVQLNRNVELRKEKHPALRTSGIAGAWKK